MRKITLYPNESDIGRRIDVFLCAHVADLTRNAAQRLLAEGQVSLQRTPKPPLKKNYRLSGEESAIDVVLPEVRAVGLVPQNLPLSIIYEDDDILVIDKARGMVVHPAAGHEDGTLVNALMYHCGDRLSGINGELRPGIVHRIDKDTSGLLVVAKNDLAHQGLAEQLQDHSMHREYEAIVVGAFREDSGTIDRPIGRSRINRKKMTIDPEGRSAITHYQVLGRYQGYSHIACRLETGRTHQIRVHMAAAGHPIIGDLVYGLKKDRFADIGGQCLHAMRLTLRHPRSGETMVFTAPRPAYFSELLQKLGQQLDESL